MAGADFSRSTGLEVIGRQAIMALYASLNAELIYQTSLWAPRDVLYAQEMDSVYQPIVLEPFKPENFYHGHIPSLLNSNVDRYPNVCAMAYQARPNNAMGGDQHHVYDVKLYVEIMCKSDMNEEEVNSRIQRTTDAAHNVLLGDRTLGGTVLSIGDAPQVEITDVFAGTDTKNRGVRFIWQGSRTDFTVQKHADLHGNRPNLGTWQDPFGVTFDLGIDQG